MKAATIHYAVGDNPLGKAIVARSGRGVCAILLGDDRETLKADLARVFPAAELLEDTAALGPLLADLAAVVQSVGTGFDHPLDEGGTPFQQRVWQALRAIAPGQTASYTDIATRIGQPDAARAVASACAANRLAIAIPCHRVVGRNGAMSGYRWGIERKRRLLEREAPGA